MDILQNAPRDVKDKILEYLTPPELVLFCSQNKIPICDDMQFWKRRLVKDFKYWNDQNRLYILRDDKVKITSPSKQRKVGGEEVPSNYRQQYMYIVSKIAETVEGYMEEENLKNSVKETKTNFIRSQLPEVYNQIDKINQEVNNIIYSLLFKYFQDYLYYDTQPDTSTKLDELIDNITAKRYGSEMISILADTFKF